MYIRACCGLSIEALRVVDRPVIDEVVVAGRSSIRDSLHTAQRPDSPSVRDVQDEPSDNLLILFSSRYALLSASLRVHTLACRRARKVLPFNHLHCDRSRIGFSWDTPAASKKAHASVSKQSRQN